MLEPVSKDRACALPQEGENTQSKRQWESL